MLKRLLGEGATSRLRRMQSVLDPWVRRRLALSLGSRAIVADTYAAKRRDLFHRN